jgi:hypothetical protein
MFVLYFLSLQHILIEIKSYIKQGCHYHPLFFKMVFTTEHNTIKSAAHNYTRKT